MSYWKPVCSTSTWGRQGGEREEGREDERAIAVHCLLFLLTGRPVVRWRGRRVLRRGRLRGHCRRGGGRRRGRRRRGWSGGARGAGGGRLARRGYRQAPLPGVLLALEPLVELHEARVIRADPLVVGRQAQGLLIIAQGLVELARGLGGHAQVALDAGVLRIDLLGFLEAEEGLLPQPALGHVDAEGQLGGRLGGGLVRLAVDDAGGAKEQERGDE